MNAKDEKRYTQDQVDIKLMESDIKAIKAGVDDINAKLSAEYVTKAELKVMTLQIELLQKLVYGVVGIILTAVVSGVVLFWINSPK